MKKIMNLVFCLMSASGFFSSSAFAESSQVSDVCATELVTLTRGLFSAPGLKKFETSIAEIKENQVEKSQTLYGGDLGGTIYTLLIKDPSKDAGLNVRVVLVGKVKETIFSGNKCFYSKRGFKAFAEDKQGNPIETLL